MRPFLLNPLFAPVAVLPGVGPKQEKNYQRLLCAHGGAPPPGAPPLRLPAPPGSSTFSGISPPARSTGELVPNSETSNPTASSLSPLSLIDIVGRRPDRVRRIGLTPTTRPASSP